MRLRYAVRSQMTNIRRVLNFWSPTVRGSGGLWLLIETKKSLGNIYWGNELSDELVHFLEYYRYNMSMLFLHCLSFSRTSSVKNHWRFRMVSLWLYSDDDVRENTAVKVKPLKCTWMEQLMEPNYSFCLMTTLTLLWKMCSQERLQRSS